MAIHTDCDNEASWVILLRKVWPTKGVDQLMDWIPNPVLGEEVPNIEWLIRVLTSTKKNYRRL